MEHRSELRLFGCVRVSDRVWLCAEIAFASSDRRLIAVPRTPLARLTKKLRFQTEAVSPLDVSLKNVSPIKMILTRRAFVR